MSLAPANKESRDAFGRHRKDRRLGSYAYFFATAIFVIGTTLSVASAKYAARIHSEYVTAEFSRKAILRSRLIKTAVETAINQIHATTAFYQASREVEPEEFQRFVAPLIERNPAFRAIEWAPRASAPGQEDSFLVSYVVPLDTNKAVIGFDLASEPERNVTLAAARDSGRVATTRPLRLIQWPHRSDGYLVIAPHYLGNPTTIEERRSTLAGFLAGVLSFEELATDALSRVGAGDLAIEAVDNGIVVASINANDAVKDGTTAPARSETVSLGGRPIALEIRATHTFVTAQATRVPLAGLALGIAISFAASLYYLSLRNRDAEREEAARSLLESERRSRILIENAPDAILVYDVDARHFIDANENAVTLTGIPYNRLLESTPLDFSSPMQLGGRSSSDAALDVMLRALNGEVVTTAWSVANPDGRHIACELRLVRLPAESRRLIRASLIDVSEKLEKDRRRKRLVLELDHRVKNTLTNVLAIAEQTSATSVSLAGFKESFVGRLRAMARAHEAIATRQWQDIPLDELVRVILSAHTEQDGQRLQYGGPAVAISPHAASSIAQIVHELATNACKHGTLSTRTGGVELTWKRIDAAGLAIEWREHGGSPSNESLDEGTGLRLIRGLIEHELGGTVSFATADEGLVCKIFLPSECLSEPYESELGS